MARDEIMAYIELMEKWGDVFWVGENREMAQRIGPNHFFDIIGTYLQ